MGKIKQTKYNINCKTIIIRNAEGQDAEQLINVIKKSKSRNRFFVKGSE